MYYGTVPGNYTQNVDVGNVISTTVNGLAECTTWYLAVKAYDAAGNESTNFSGELQGIPRPQIQQVTPSSAEAGTRLNLTVQGFNYEAGASADFLDPSITVHSATVNACETMTLDVTVGASAAAGARDLEVVNVSSVFGAGVGVFTVNAATAPLITNVRSENVGSSSAEIAWSTDEDADTEVWYRRQGETTWQSSSLDAALTQVHRVTLQGLVAAAGYEYVVRSSDAGGNLAVSDPPSSFQTTDAGFAFMRMEMEQALITAPYTEGADAAALMGGYIETPSGSPTGTTASPTGTATFRFRTDSSATWYVWVRSYAPNGNSDRLFEQMNGGGRQTMTTASPGSWQWTAGRNYPLTAGDHELEFGGQDPRARIDRVLLTDDPNFQPTESPEDDNAAPQAVTSLAPTAGDQQITLDWIDPNESDLDRVVVRYRTDGVSPGSIYDGTEAGFTTGSPGNASGFVHTGLINGTTYSYGVFSVDVDGNASLVETTEATPQDSTAPGDVAGLVRSDVK